MVAPREVEIAAFAEPRPRRPDGGRRGDDGTVVEAVIEFTTEDWRADFFGLAGEDLIGRRLRGGRAGVR